jgi:hypothetical protein
LRTASISVRQLNKTIACPVGCKFHIVNNFFPFLLYSVSGQPNMTFMKIEHRISLHADTESVQERLERYKAEAKKLRNEDKKLAAFYQTQVAERAKLQKDAVKFQKATAKMQAHHLAATQVHPHAAIQERCARQMWR